MITKRINTLKWFAVFGIAYFLLPLHGWTAPESRLGTTLAPEIALTRPALQSAVAQSSARRFAEQLISEDEALFAEISTTLGKSRVCDLPGRQRYVEDLVGELEAGTAVEVAFVSIQNFKQEFNDRGNELNEMVEIAKLFGSAQSHAFINSVLDKAARVLRPLETVTAPARGKGG